MQGTELRHGALCSFIVCIIIRRRKYENVTEKLTVTLVPHEKILIDYCLVESGNSG